MSFLTPLAEYILGYTAPDGHKLARFGTQRYTIPLLPPNFPVVFQIGPYYGAHANILFASRWSPSIVPNTILFETSHKGILYHSGLLGSWALAEPHNVWLEVTEKNLIRTRLINQSPINQFFESVDAFLVIQSEPDLAEVRQLVQRYSNVAAVEAKLDTTNAALAAISRSLGAPTPRPPIGGS